MPPVTLPRKAAAAVQVEAVRGTRCSPGRRRARGRGCVAPLELAMRTPKRAPEGDAGEASAHGRISDHAMSRRRFAAPKIHFLFGKSRLGILHRLLFSLLTESPSLVVGLTMAVPAMTMSRFGFATGEALTGIPCNHVVAFLTHERTPAEVLPARLIY